MVKFPRCALHGHCKSPLRKLVDQEFQSSHYRRVTFSCGLPSQWYRSRKLQIARGPSQLGLLEKYFIQLNLLGRVNRLNIGKSKYMVTSQPKILKTRCREEDLVLQAKAGSHTAFEELYRMHLDHVYAICIRILSDRFKAEEVTQKIFIRAWIKLQSFRGDSRFSSWLYRLSVNMILDELKLNRTKDDSNIEKERSVLFNASCSESARNLQLDLNSAIDSLPPQARIIFVMHDVVGFTHEEIAEALSLAAGTCKAHLSRARRLLREGLKNEL